MSSRAFTDSVNGLRIQGIGFRVILGLYRDNGKDNGNYYLGFRVQGLPINPCILPVSTCVSVLLHVVLCSCNLRPASLTELKEHPSSPYQR